MQSETVQNVIFRRSLTDAENRFRPRLCPGPSWGSSWRTHNHNRMGRDMASPYPPFRRFRRLVLSTFDVSPQRIRGFTTMRYINLRFTYLLT